MDKGQALDGEFSYLASLVYWTDGKLFDMNVPDFQYNSRLGLDLDRIRKNKLLLIDTCSFVGCFINLKYAETAGLPISEFFIYGDDQEYTARLRKLAPAYLDFDSVIVHKAPSNKGADVVSADETRIERFFYQARNGMYIARKNGKVGRRLRVIGGRIKNILRKAPDHKAKRVWVTCKGTISGFSLIRRLNMHIEKENNRKEMGKQKSLKLNFVMNAILTMSQFVFPLITFPYVSRILLPIGTGKVSFATSIVSYFTLFAQLGIPTYGIRACAKVRDNREELSKMVQELFIINLMMSALAYVVYFAAIYYVPRFRQDKDLFLIVGLTIFFNAIGMEWLYKALEQYTYITVRSIIFKFIAIVAMFLMVHEQSDYVIYGGISILASSASNIFNFFHIHRYVNIKPVGHYNFKKHLKAIVIFFAMSCATTIYTHLDTVMLGFIRTDADVGYYNAAVKIKTILVSIVTSLGVVLLPRASYYVEHSMMDEFYRITKRQSISCF